MDKLQLSRSLMGQRSPCCLCLKAKHCADWLLYFRLKPHKLRLKWCYQRASMAVCIRNMKEKESMDKLQLSPLTYGPA
jgi:hypothetical protein